VTNPAACSNREVQRGRLHLVYVLLGNSLLRISGGASGILVGLYLANRSNRRSGSGAPLAGALGALAFGSELVSVIPMGVAADALAPRGLMTTGALLAAAATQLFGMTGRAAVFFLSRILEGLGAAAVAPSLLAHLTDVTENNPRLRARMMSYFELSLLAGVAVGGLLAGQLWSRLEDRAFGAVAAVYLVAAVLLYFGAAGSRRHNAAQARHGLWRALREPALRRLAPVWLCVNAIIGLWLGPAFSFLITERSSSGQFLAGLFAGIPQTVGWVLLGYSTIFGAGVTIWSFILPRMKMVRALGISLFAMFGACAGLYLFNHSHSASHRWILGIVTSVLIMVESGFTPAALSLLAGAIGSEAGRGAAMGIYSVLLSLGAIIGSLLAGWLGNVWSVDGLIYGTAVMAAIALALVQTLRVEGE
jgi:MFS family permease